METDLTLGGNPRTLGTTVYVLAGLVFLAIAWSYVTRVDVIVRASGVVRPEGDVIQITSEVSGRIETVHVREGDSIVAGQTLVQLDTAHTRSQHENLKQRIALVEQQLQDNRLAIHDAARIHDLSADKLAREIDLARRELFQNKQEHALQMEAAAAGFDAARREHSRVQRLYSEGLVSRQERDRIETELNLARVHGEEVASRSPSEATLNSLLAARVLADAEFNARRRELETEATPLEAQMNDLQSQLEQIEMEKDRRTIRSPSTGQLTLLPKIHPGEYLEAESFVGTLAPTPTQMVVEALVGNRDARNVRQGQTARLRIDDWETLRGVVTSVSPDARLTEPPVGVYRVVITPADLSLRLGQGLDVRLITRQERLLTLLFQRVERAFVE